MPRQPRRSTQPLDGRHELSFSFLHSLLRRELGCRVRSGYGQLRFPWFVGLCCNALPKQRYRYANADPCRNVRRKGVRGLQRGELQSRSRSISGANWGDGYVLVRKGQIQEMKSPQVCRLTPRWSGRVIDKVPSSYIGVRAAQLNR